MEDTNRVEICASEALAGVLAFGGSPRTWTVPEDATIQLKDGTGHLLTGATITAWGN